MWEGVDHFTEDNAPEAVDVVREQPAQQALVTEQVDQCNARQHRRRHQWQQRHTAPEGLAGNQRALQGVGKQVGQRYDNGRHAEGDFQAIAQQPVEVGTGDQLPCGDQATALPGLAAETAPEDRQQWQQYGDAQQHQPEQFAADHENTVAGFGA